MKRTDMQVTIRRRSEGEEGIEVIIKRKENPKQKVRKQQDKKKTRIPDRHTKATPKHIAIAQKNMH